MKQVGLIVGIWATALLVAAFVTNQYILTVATAAAFLGMFAQSWNIQSGLSGNLSVGHSIFIAVPAYVTVILYQEAGIPPMVGGLIGVFAGVVVAAIIGAVTLRLSGPYFSLATLSASAVVLGLILHFGEITGGPSGLPITFTKDNPFHFEFVKVYPYFVIAATLLAAVTLLLSLTRKSKLGYYAAAIKSSEESSAAAGVQVARVKIIIFCLSAASIGVGSVFYVFFIGFADPNHLAGTTLSVQIALIAVIGGLNYLVGPILGAIFYETIDVTANAMVGAAGGWNTMVLGLSVVILVMTEPRGLCELAVQFWQKIRGKSSNKIVVSRLSEVQSSKAVGQ